MNCTACENELHNSTDTFGPTDMPFCWPCWSALEWEEALPIHISQDKLDQWAKNTAEYMHLTQWGRIQVRPNQPLFKENQTREDKQHANNL